MEKINILIADDEMESCQLVQKGLLKHGFNVDVAFDGKEALDRIKTNNYDFAFLDFNMPELTGIEVAKTVKQKDFKCVLVMITGYPAIDEFFAKTLGIDEYLHKPFSIGDIKNIINKYTDKDKKDG